VAQAAVRRGILAAIAASVVWFGAGYRLTGSLAVADDAAGRVNFVLPWLVLFGLPLLVAVGALGRYRYRSPAAIDGASVDDPAFDIARRILQNTTEQVLLALPAALALAMLLPVGMLALVPLWAVWFLIARTFFWYGYHRAPAGRAFGFAATFYPAVMAHGLALALLAVRFYSST
jgi:hypothetical protein